MSVFTDEELRFFDDHGYVVLHDAAPPENLQAVIDAIWGFLDMNPDDPDDWYRSPHRTNGMVEIYHHQALWNNRQQPRIHAAFAQLHGTEKLWVSEDRACMKPPCHPAHPEYDNRGFIHWDLDTAQPLPANLRLQGVLCLTETTAAMGGFQCVPGFHKNLADWVARQPPGRDPRSPDLAALPAGMQVTPVPARAGDLIIWNNLLAHGNGHNVSDRPRLAQYIAMRPAPQGADAQLQRQTRLDRHATRVCPKIEPHAGDPRHWEELHGQPVELTLLGRKLLGLELWD